VPENGLTFNLFFVRWHTHPQGAMGGSCERVAQRLHYIDMI